MRSQGVCVPRLKSWGSLMDNMGRETEFALPEWIRLQTIYIDPIEDYLLKS